MNIFTKLLVLPALATTLLAANAEAARVYDCAGGGELEIQETIRLPLTYQQRRDLDRERSAHTKARSEIERILRAIPILERRARQARQQYNHPASP